MSKYASYGLPWRSGIGTDVRDCATSREVLDKAGLNFMVEKCELYAQMPFNLVGDNSVNETMGEFAHKGEIYRPCPNGYATYRTDKNIPLGIVKSKYEVVQNIEAFNFIDNAIGEDKASFQYAGCFGYGHKVFITAKLPITTTIGGDPIDNYLVFSTSHDGTGSIDILFTPIRVFCLNCMGPAIKEADSHIRIRHTRSAQDKLNFGAEVLRVAMQYAEHTKELYDSLLTIKMSDDEVRDYISRLFLTPSEYATVCSEFKDHTIRKIFNKDYLTMENIGISTRKANILSTVFDYYQTGVAQEHILGTAWGAYNAITGYYSNVKEQDGEKRMNNLIFGGDRLAMSKALNEAINFKVSA
jgi:phage/plasmid-like protein (TIGR03299 family)